MKRLITVTLAVFAMISLTYSSAFGAAGTSSRASISLNKKTCELTAQYMWKNVPSSSFGYAGLQIFEDEANAFAEVSDANPLDLSGTLTTTYVGRPGHNYSAFGWVWDGVASQPTNASSRTIAILRCG